MGCVSKERETSIFVSLVTRETVALRGAKLPVELADDIAILVILPLPLSVSGGRDKKGKKLWLLERGDSLYLPQFLPATWTSPNPKSENSTQTHTNRR